MSSTKSPHTPPRTRRRSLVIIGALALASGLLLWRSQRPREVLVVRVARGPIQQTVVSSGRVLPSAKVRLGAMVRGIVKDVLVDEGQHVAAGEVVLVLRDDELRADLMQASADLQQADARLRLLTSNEGRLASEQLKRAETELAKTLAEHQRTQKLVARGAAARAQLDESERKLAQAQEARERARLNVENTAVKGGEYKVRQSSSLGARGALARATVRLDYLRVVAPAAGVILTRDVEPGDVVEAGRTLLVLGRDGATRLLIQPDEQALGIVRVGQAARASAEAFPAQSFTATVAWIAPLVDPSRGTIDIKLTVPNPPAYLRSDMTVSVTVAAQKRPRALLVPPEAIGGGISDESPWVVVLRDYGVRRVPVTLGLRSARAIELTSGVAEGEFVALDPGLSDGARVRTRVSR